MINLLVKLQWSSFMRMKTCTKYKFITSAYLLVDALSKIKDSLPVLVTIRKSADPSNPIRSYLRFE